MGNKDENVHLDIWVSLIITWQWLMSKLHDNESWHTAGEWDVSFVRLHAIIVVGSKGYLDQIWLFSPHFGPFFLPWGIYHGGICWVGEKEVWIYPIDDIFFCWVIRFGSIHEREMKDKIIINVQIACATRYGWDLSNTTVWWRILMQIVSL